VCENEGLTVELGKERIKENITNRKGLNFIN